MEVVAELLEFVTVELLVVIRYDGVWNFVVANDVSIYKLLDLHGRDR